MNHQGTKDTKNKEKLTTENAEGTEVESQVRRD